MNILKFPVLLVVVLLFTFSLSSCGGGDSDPEPDVDVVDPPADGDDDGNASTDEQIFDDFVASQMSSQRLPAVGAIIFKDDQILHEGYYGKSNVEQNLPLEESHLFLIASISKTVTGVALLRLYDEGKFDLDDPINDYLSFPVNNPNSDTPITFRMLLTHTSSIIDGDLLYDNYTFGGDTPIALKSFMESYLKEGGSRYDANDNFSDAEAGTEFNYSNAASALIGLLVEEISGKSFVEYTRDDIFTPLGMLSTSWRLDEITETIVQPYEVEDDDFVKIDHYTFPDYPNGGLRTTPREMANFTAAIANGGSFDGYELLKSSTVEEMLTKQIPNLDETMGLHMFLQNESLGLWGHNGGEQGTSTEMAFDPVTKIGVLVFTNMSDADLTEIYEEAFELGKKLQ
ncbi:serine hydrolase domain-containing protein [Bernardetia sp. ABR2-2B]|uniref:serine hydrolase domain-containing protein n=1 Tax=Bernardetia sp. ABR2-2B TaxID=3127472 RepID=UPI0030D3D339